MRRPRALFSALLILLIPLLPAAAAAHDAQHGPDEGHLLGTGAWDKIELVGQLEVSGATDDLIADVAVFGDYAYLANWGVEDCAGPETGGRTSPDAGAWVIDISDPAEPEEVGFIALPQDTRPGEGMQVIHMETKWFTGDVLVMNAEGCGKNYKGGVMLFDVTDPTNPQRLRLGVGDRTANFVHQTHSVFAWTMGDQAFLVAQDEEDLLDVDVYEITNPHNPRLLTELDLNDYGVAQFDLNLGDSSLHDMVVKQIGEAWYMLLSYWDGGFVVLDVTIPAEPQFVGDTDYANVDPELLEQTGVSLTPEGNAHQAEWTSDDRFIIGTDEDFGPYRALVETDDGGSYPAGEFGWTVPIGDLYGTLNGPTVFGGYGCPTSPDLSAIPHASTLTLDEGEEAILVLQRGPSGDPSATYQGCFFSEKVETAQTLGYDAVIIANHHIGAMEGLAPDAYLCGSQGHDFTVEISAICTGHRALHELFDGTATYSYPETLPVIGAVGDEITVTTAFDGWGYVHLIDAETLEMLDTFAIPEAMQEAYATGYGDLSVHEVATDPTDPSLAYLSYYSGGLRAIQIQCTDPADTSTCELVEVGGYLDEAGNDFWGVEAVPDPDNPGEVLIFASDRDYGLFIFRDP